MPVTRSATRSATVAATTGAVQETATVVTKTSRKRKAAEATKESTTKKPRATKGTAKSKSTTQSETSSVPQPQPASTGVVTPVVAADGEELVPAVLTFSFEDAKRHLISVDPRFEEVFRRVQCKPFEHLERVDPFRTLASSILGQQISWKAARAITHKFKRLFDSSIPENLADSDSDFFPSAHQVITKDIATLRTAGLSVRKAEYVLDLASRFADGRLSTRKLLEADDEELYRLLTAVRGIGPWTVHMFAMFHLRRPDILPVGDLGVQKGMLRWFLSLHSPAHPVSLRKDKLIDPEASDSPVAGGSQEGQGLTRATTPDASSTLAAPDDLPSTPRKNKADGSGAEPETDSMLPTPFTPSINRTLNMFGKRDTLEADVEIPSLPEGLTVPQMKARLGGKSKIKGALLTPKEMEALTDNWRPYRSLGVYYMWALAEEPS